MRGSEGRRMGAKGREERTARGAEMGGLLAGAPRPGGLQEFYEGLLRREETRRLWRRGRAFPCGCEPQVRAGARESQGRGQGSVMREGANAVWHARMR